VEGEYLVSSSVLLVSNLLYAFRFLLLLLLLLLMLVLLLCVSSIGRGIEKEKEVPYVAAQSEYSNELIRMYVWRSALSVGRECTLAVRCCECQYRTDGTTRQI